MFSSSSPLNELDALSSSARAKLQIQSYEALLSLRIALQRSLDLANKLPVIPSDEVIEALNEQSTKDSEKKDLSEEYSHLHDSLHQLQSGLYESLASQRESGKGEKKRRRDELSDSPDAQWKEISELQGSLEEKWKMTLNKWHGRMHFGSEKVKNSLTVFNVAAWDQIEDHVSHENKTLEKSRIPLEESERIGARTVSFSEEKRRKTDVDLEVYDDRAFYSLLLKVSSFSLFPLSLLKYCRRLSPLIPLRVEAAVTWRP